MTNGIVHEFRATLSKVPKYPSAVILILANFSILISILYLGLPFGQALLVFWVEACAILVFTFLKAMLSKTDIAFKIMSVPAFLGMLLVFMPAYLLFFNFFAEIGSPFGEAALPLDFDILLVSIPLVLTHFVSFLLNFIGRGEREKADFELIYRSAGYRLVTVHMTIWLTGFTMIPLLFMFGMQAPIFAFVFAKTAIDVYTHIKEREAAARKAKPARIKLRLPERHPYRNKISQKNLRIALAGASLVATVMVLGMSATLISKVLQDYHCSGVGPRLAEVQALITKENPCTEDSDCRILPNTPVINCFSISKNANETKIIESFNRFAEKFYGCFEDVPYYPCEFLYRPKCVEGQCNTAEISETGRRAGT